MEGGITGLGWTGLIYTVNSIQLNSTTLLKLNIHLERRKGRSSATQSKLKVAVADVNDNAN